MTAKSAFEDTAIQNHCLSSLFAGIDLAAGTGSTPLLRDYDKFEDMGLRPEVLVRELRSHFVGLNAQSARVLVIFLPCAGGAEG